MQGHELVAVPKVAVAVAVANVYLRGVDGACDLDHPVRSIEMMPASATVMMAVEHDEPGTVPIVSVAGKVANMNRRRVDINVPLGGVIVCVLEAETGVMAAKAAENQSCKRTECYRLRDHQR